MICCVIHYIKEDHMLIYLYCVLIYLRLNEIFIMFTYEKINSKKTNKMNHSLYLYNYLSQSSLKQYSIIICCIGFLIL